MTSKSYIGFDLAIENHRLAWTFEAAGSKAEGRISYYRPFATVGHVTCFLRTH